jgi:hypothetical protein
VEVKFIKPTIDLVEAIASDMRQADADEVWASHRHTPIQAMMSSWAASDFSVIVTINNEPCVMIGLVIRDILMGCGVPWMLGTNNALKYKKHYVTQVPPVINEMLTICPELFNYVHGKNKVSINWLRKFGFIIDEPTPHGYGGELFHRFHLRGHNNV